ncbi:MAG: cation diffusion facilitator family transporter [Gammaproteobacteria bacterium]|nr:cation diffusion facilitator family transporter [Gammaproteobacteria bacterium]
MTMPPRPAAHDHRFGADNSAAERGTRLVMWITAVTMVIEIVAGWWFNSMALLADGWHMSSHALAIGLSAYAYAAARREADDHRYAFGTWKIEVLGGFASAVLLLGVAALMVGGSIERLFRPAAIRYEEAIAIAVLGLIVNVACAVVLARAHDHDHDHHHDHHEHHDHESHHDLNLRAAYLHVVADAATSVLAIAALAFTLGLDPESKVLALVAWAWAGFGAAFGPAVVLSLYWSGMTRAGALAGILVGGVTVLLWKRVASLGGVFEIYELVPGFVLSALAILIVSSISRRNAAVTKV